MTILKTLAEEADMTLTPEQLAFIKKAEDRQAARALKKAARLGTLSAQLETAHFRENARLDRLRDRRPSVCG